MNPVGGSSVVGAVVDLVVMVGGAGLVAVVLCVGCGLRRVVRRRVYRRWLARVRAGHVPIVKARVVDPGVLPVVRSRVVGERVVWPVGGVER